MTRKRCSWSSAVLLLAVACTQARADDAKLPALLEQLKSPNAGLRGQAAMSISQLGAAAQAAVPALATALGDRDLNVRYWAASALKAIGPGAKGAVPALVEALKTFPGGSPPLEGPPRYYADVRSVAAEALGSIGPAAREAIPALKQATGDKDPSVSGIASAALKKIVGN